MWYKISDKKFTVICLILKVVYIYILCQSNRILTFSLIYMNKCNKSVKRTKHIYTYLVVFHKPLVHFKYLVSRSKVRKYISILQKGAFKPYS